MEIITNFNNHLVEKLLSGGIAVLRTDTIYGIVAKADNQAAVERVYGAKGRTPSKSPIVLLANMNDLFDNPSPDEKAMIKGLWPGKNSIIFPSSNAPSWLIRGNESMAYRIPNDESLLQLLERTGPLIAPSANPEGQPPAMNIQEAVAYFYKIVDIYVDGGQIIDNTPSKLFKITKAGLERLR